MKLGFIGLGKMGGNMVERLLSHGHEIVAYNRTRDNIDEAVSKGAIGAESPADILDKLPERKVVWLMVPSGAPVEQNINALLAHMSEGDIIIDGGNSNWRDTIARGKRIAEHGVHYIDCGTSGGIWGLKNGYCLMYGGADEPCAHVEPVFKALAPAEGYLHCGPSGSGHFVKMVHNGIEYGMMQAYAEGFEIMKESPFDLDMQAVSHVWRFGSVIQSWLLELAERAFADDPELEQLEPFVQDSGEGRWTVQAAIDFNVPAPVITDALYARFQSRNKDSFGFKLLAALRNQFGGHAVKKK